MKIAFLPLAQYLPYSVLLTVGGSILVERFFSVPGIGRQVLLGIQQKEYAVVQSTVLVIALTFVVVNLATDLLYRAIDPRVRAV